MERRHFLRSERHQRADHSWPLALLLILFPLILVASDSRDQAARTADHASSCPPESTHPLSQPHAPRSFVQNTFPLKSSSYWEKIHFVDERHGWGILSFPQDEWSAIPLLMRTSDGGLSWQKAFSFFPGKLDEAGPPPVRIGRMVTSFISATEVWVLYPVYIYKGNEEPIVQTHVLHTTDAGRSWQERSFLLNIAPIAVGWLDEKHGWLLYEMVTDKRQVQHLARTSDAGRSWFEVFSFGRLIDQEDLPYRLDFNVNSVHFLTQCLGWTTIQIRTEKGAWSELYLTQDGGKTWRNQKLPLPPSTRNDPLILAPISFDRSSGLLAVVYEEKSFAQQKGQVVLMTTNDGGLSWQRMSVLSVPLKGPGPYESRKDGLVSFVDSKSGWMLTNNDFQYTGPGPIIYETSDGGKTWTPLPSSPLLAARYYIWQLQMVSKNVGWVLGAFTKESPITFESMHNTQVEMFKTVDGGVNWSRIHPKISLS